MPITDEQKQIILQRMGYAPYEMDLVQTEGGYALQPLNTTSEGMVKSALKLAASKIPRTAAQMAGGTLGAAIAAPASAAIGTGVTGATSFTGPAAPLIGAGAGLVTEGLAFAGGSKVGDMAYNGLVGERLDKALYDSEAQRLRTEAEHPILSKATDVGAMLASMKFANPISALGSLSKLAKLGMLSRGEAAALTTADKLNISNLARNVIGNAAFSAGNQALQHGDVDAGQVAWDAGTGMFFGRPRGVLGAPGAAVEKYYANRKAGGIPLPAGTPPPLPREVDANLADPVAAAQAKAERAGIDWEHYYEKAAATANSPDETAALFAKAVDAAVTDPNAKRVSPVQVTKPTPPGVNQFPKGYQLPGMNPTRQTVDLAEWAPSTPMVKGGDRFSEAGLNPKAAPAATSKDLAETTPYTKPVKAKGEIPLPGMEPVQALAPDPTFSRRYQDLGEAGADPADRAALERRGFEFSEQDAPIEGRAAGRFDRNTGRIDVAAPYAGPDTYTHEGMHAELWDMLQSPKPKVRQAALDVLKAAYRPEHGDTPDNAATEEITVRGATDASRTQRGGNELLRTIKDNWNWFRTTRLGGRDMTPERMARIIAERFDYSEPGKVAGGGAGERFQDLARISQVPGSVLGKAAKVDKEAADAASRAFNERDMLLGKANTLLEELKKFKPEVVQSMGWKRSRAGQTQTAPQFTPEEAAANAVYQKFMDMTAAEAIAAGYPINQQGNYVPEMTSVQAARDFETTANGQKLLKDFHDLNQQVYGAKYDPIEGESYFRTYMTGVAKAPNSLGSDFGALTKFKRQYHLPDSVREQDMMENLRRYANRWASGVAKKRHVLNDPNIAARLGYDGDVVYPSGATAPPQMRPELTDLKMALDDVLFNQGRGATGLGQNTRDMVMAGQQVVNSAVMQTLTALKNTVLKVPMHLISAQNPDQAAALISGTVRSIAEYQVQKAKAIAANVIKPNVDPAFDGALPLSSQVAKNLKNVAQVERKYSGAEFFEVYNRVQDYTIGEELAKVNIPLAKTGDKAAVRFLEQFGAGADTTQPMAEQVARIARNYTKGIQGSYGPEGLPATMLKGGPLAHVMRIQRFGIENLGRVRQMVIEPARQGDYRPLFAYTLGLVVTAPLVIKMAELFSGRPSGLPSDEEIKAGNRNALLEHTLNIMSMAQVTGAFGIGGNLAGGVAQNWRGNRQQLIGDPSINFALDSLNNMGLGATAVANGEPVIPTLMEVMKRTVLDNMQLARTFTTDRDEAEDLRNKRVFEYQAGERDVSPQDRLAGMVMGSMLSGRSPQISPTKEAARDGDPAALAKLTPAQITALDNYRGGYEDPEKEAQYMAYIQRTQGPEALRAYVKRRYKPR